MNLLLSFLTGGGLSRLTDRLADAYEAKQRAQTDREKLRADMTISQLEARRDALVKGQGAWLSKAVQAAWAAPFIVYNAKVIIWDKVLAWGVTDPLGPFETNLGWIIAGFYFLTVSVGALRR